MKTIRGGKLVSAVSTSESNPMKKDSGFCSVGKRSKYPKFDRIVRFGRDFTGKQ